MVRHTLGLLVPLAAALSVPLKERANFPVKACGYNTLTAGPYQLFFESGGVGSQVHDCTTVTSLSGNTLVWETTWDTSGGSGIDFISVEQGWYAGGTMHSLEATWNWEITNAESVQAQILLDFTLGIPNDNGGNSIETWSFNIWLAGYSLKPHGSVIASGVSIAGFDWDLYWDPSWSYAFFPSSGTPVTAFTADIKDFFEYLVTNNSAPSNSFFDEFFSQITAYAGTNVTLSTSAYSLVLDTN